MKHFLGRIKATMKAISWPCPKSVIVDTLVTVLTTTILAITIALWTGGLEFIINTLSELF